MKFNSEFKLLEMQNALRRAQSAKREKVVSKLSNRQCLKTYESDLFKVVIHCEHGRNNEVLRLLEIDSVEELMQEAELANVEIIEKEVKRVF